MSKLNGYVTVEVQLSFKGLRGALANAIQLTLLKEAANGKMESEYANSLTQLLVDATNRYFDSYVTMARDTSGDE